MAARLAGTRMTGCADLAGGLGLAPALLAQADCHAEALAAGGYGALTADGGLVSTLAAATLGLCVAIQGWRLLLGHAPHIGDWTLTLLKIGFVLALTSQWPTYQRLLYDTAVHGPEEVAAAVLGGYRAQSGEPMVDREALQRTYRALLAASAQADESQARLGDAVPAGVGQGDQGATPRAAAQPAANRDYATAALLLLLSTVGVLVAAKLLTALVLALGPLVLLLLLFEQTRGLTIGWARALVGLALTLIYADVLGAIEVSLLRPVLRAINPLGLASSGAQAQGASALAVTSICAVTILIGAVAVWAIALGFHPPAPRTRGFWPNLVRSPAVQPSPTADSLRPSAADVRFVERGATAQREARGAAAAGASVVRHMMQPRPAAGPELADAAQIGMQPRRLLVAKLSAAAERRDR